LPATAIGIKHIATKLTAAGRIPSRRKGWGLR